MMSSTLAAGASWHLAANKCTPTATVELAVKPNRNPKCKGCCLRNHTLIPTQCTIDRHRRRPPGPRR
uniref:Uncharacterized protein n=1 Tax=Oryza glaberrima TaxID=4538 RepID=I1P6H3_ORYGL